MSAFIVSDYHINCLINFTIDNRISLYSNNKSRDLYQNPGKYAQVLLDENQRSINERYGEDDSETIEFKKFRSGLKPIEIIKACDCYDYQACETKNYDTTLASAIIDIIRKRATCMLPEYDNAKGWGMEEPVVEVNSSS